MVDAKTLRDGDLVRFEYGGCEGIGTVSFRRNEPMVFWVEHHGTQLSNVRIMSLLQHSGECSEMLRDAGFEE